MIDLALIAAISARTLISTISSVMAAIVSTLLR
jgi:hypothetical protein